MNITQTVFTIRGMHCASCARSVEVNIGKLGAVQSVSVNLAGESAAISYDADTLSPKDIISAINKLGFKASLPSADSADEETSALKREKTKLCIALIFAGLIFIIAMGPMLGLFRLPSFLAAPKVLTITQLILVIPVIICGFRFYTSGFKSLFRGSPNMDTLIAVGTIAALSYSIYSTVLVYKGDQHAVHNLYFESATMQQRRPPILSESLYHSPQIQPLYSVMESKLKLKSRRLKSEILLSYAPANESLSMVKLFPAQQKQTNQ